MSMENTENIDVKNEARNKEKRVKKRVFLITLFGLIFSTFGYQLMVFWGNLPGLGICLLIGTTGTLVGAFTALLSSPYGSDDKERLSKVSSTIATLVTGFLLAKVIDPLVTYAMSTPSTIFGLLELPYNSANVTNVLMAIISFLGGFLLTYEFRAYISGERLNDT